MTSLQLSAFTADSEVKKLSMENISVDVAPIDAWSYCNFTSSFRLQNYDSKICNAHLRAWPLDLLEMIHLCT